VPRIERQRPRRLFRGAEFGRLMTMICMLVVLGMMIKTASNPGTWQWLVSKPGQANQVVGQEGGSDKSRPDQMPVTPTPSIPVDGRAENRPAKTTEGEPQPKKIPIATGPTDEDEAELSGAAEDFDFVADGSVQIQPEEMSAYRRLVRWVIDQPYQRLSARAAERNPTYGQFVTSPQEFRQPGEIFAFDVHVREVIKFDVKLAFRDEDDDAPRPPATLYEVWGTTDESRGRFLHFVVYDPPAGLPIGPNVREDVRFVGYFFRNQGYIPAKAPPDSRVQLAPSFIGRVAWEAPRPGVVVEESELPWLILFGGGAAAILVSWLGFIFLGKRRRSVAELATDLPPPPGTSVEEWLDEVGGPNNA
jgi:hypothetical protein